MSDTTIEVACVGMLDVLSVGKGDIKLSIGSDDPEEVDKGRKLIEEMLSKGYTIVVETEAGPRRVKRFDPQHLDYIVTEVVDPPPAKGKRTRDHRVPVAGSRATAIGRTAGG